MVTDENASLPLLAVGMFNGEVSKDSESYEIVQCNVISLLASFQHFFSASSVLIRQ